MGGNAQYIVSQKETKYACELEWTLCLIKSGNSFSQNKVGSSIENIVSLAQIESVTRSDDQRCI